MLKVRKKKLLPYQAEFINDREHEQLALVGGLGTGKTKTACWKAIDLLQRNPGCNGIGAEPTSTLLAVLVAEMQSIIRDEFIDAKLKGQSAIEPPRFEFNFGHGVQKLYLLSAENWRRSFIGHNVAFGFIDEADTIRDFDEAMAMWDAINDRVRDPRAKVLQSFVTTTPEGFHWVHDVFVKNASPYKRIWNVSTFENKYLKPSYVQRQLRQYSEQKAKAKVYGQFIDNFGTSVYCDYDPERNKTDLTLADFDPEIYSVHIGMDFNVEHMAATISFYKHINGEDVKYTVAEIVEEMNTDSMIRAIKEMGLDQYEVIIYPDSSGKGRSPAASEAAASSIAKLEAEGWDCEYTGNNPGVVDRVDAVNARFYSGDGLVRSFVNPVTCPTLDQNLRRQGWRRGRPDKRNNIDHVLDAFGYPDVFLFPLHLKGTVTSL